VSCFIQLGKIGDIVSILPVVESEYIITGEKPKLLVASEYAHVLQGLDYVEPVIFSGGWGDLSAAVRVAKGQHTAVKVAQTHARDFPIERKHPSFQYDQWARCGALKDWGMLPLNYPSANTTIPKQPFILLGDKSESSPFAVENLAQALTNEFPSHQIVRLSNVSVSRLAELVELYDAADLIITIDTAHLHLSQASSTPVIALATDSPGRWRGSAHHPRFALHLRYSDVPHRTKQLFHVAKMAVNKSSKPHLFKQQVAVPCAYNPSVLRVGNKLWKTYRHHPSDSWRTGLTLQIEEGSKVTTTAIKLPGVYSYHSHEDSRLFMHNGKPHMSLTIARGSLMGESGSRCVIGYGELKETGVVDNLVIPKYGKNDWSGMEKNWVFWSDGSKLYFTYKLSPEHEVVEFRDGAVRQVYRSPVPNVYYGTPRGGTPPITLDDGTHMRFFHALQTNRKSDVWWTYHLGAMITEPHPPFRVLKISQHPIASGDESYSPECPKWKPRVLIPYGAIPTPGGFDVHVGVNDCQCAIIRTKFEHLNL
jgi:predicted GH43/DUF377 family glycosyl hydrolase